MEMPVHLSPRPLYHLAPQAPDEATADFINLNVSSPSIHECVYSTQLEELLLARALLAHCGAPSPKLQRGLRWSRRASMTVECERNRHGRARYSCYETLQRRVPRVIEPLSNAIDSVLTYISAGR